MTWRSKSASIIPQPPLSSRAADDVPHNFLFVHFIQVNKIDHAEQDGAGAGRAKTSGIIAG